MLKVCPAKEGLPVWTLSDSRLYEKIYTLLVASSLGSATADEEGVEISIIERVSRLIEHLDLTQGS